MASEASVWPASTASSCESASWDSQSCHATKKLKNSFKHWRANHSSRSKKPSSFCVSQQECLCVRVCPGHRLTCRLHNSLQFEKKSRALLLYVTRSLRPPFVRVDAKALNGWVLDSLVELFSGKYRMSSDPREGSATLSLSLSLCSTFQSASLKRFSTCAGLCPCGVPSVPFPGP